MGQILRVSVAMHVLFHIEGNNESDDSVVGGEDEGGASKSDNGEGVSGDFDGGIGSNDESGGAGIGSGVSDSEDDMEMFHDDTSLSATVSKRAIKAAINFVEVCCQHTAHIAGRGDINAELELIGKGWFYYNNTAHIIEYHHL